MKSKNIIKGLTDLSDRLLDEKDKILLTDTILEISKLRDEIESVWDLIEEMNASDIRNFKKQIEESVAEKLLSSTAMLSLKGGDDYGPN
tara:strand:+ start:849 stop:1115 length:267 start_codon:yes stop_codon:yes gene_type:complete